MVKPLDPGILEKLRRAAEIAKRALKLSETLVKPGAKIIEICERLEGEIKKLGGSPAFPVNVSVNEIAAHYSSPPGDTRVIPPSSIVKIDVGVHIDGYIVDVAKTLCFNRKLRDLVRATEEALDAAVERMRDGVRTSEIGSVIEKTIRGYGYHPIKNLSGHSMERYNLHAGVSIPNVSSVLGAFSPKLREGMIVAVEPFATTGSRAFVVDSQPVAIFRLTGRRPEDGEMSKIYAMIYKRCRELPFSLRWFKEIVKTRKALTTFQRMVASKHVHAYPALREVDGNPVAQAETTVVIRKNGAERLL